MGKKKKKESKVWVGARGLGRARKELFFFFKKNKFNFFFLGGGGAEVGVGPRWIGT